MNKRLISLLMAFVMVMGILVMPFSALAEGEKTTKSVTVHKMLLTKDNAAQFGKDGKQVGLDGTKYDGKQIKNMDAYFGTDQKQIAGVYFVWQKQVKPLVNADDEKDDKNWEYVKEDGTKATGVDDAFGKLTTTDGVQFDTSKLPAGKYRIQEVKEKSTYKGEDGKTLTGMYAVPVYLTLPMVNEAGVIENAHVYPKNTEDAPKIDKNFKENTDGATDTKIDYKNNQRDKNTINRKVGDTVEYQVSTEIPKEADYKFLKWTDAMSDGLTYTKGSLKVTSDQMTGENALADGDYTVEEDARGYTIKFTDSGLKKITAAAKTTAVTIKFAYSAVLNGKAEVEKPEKNDVALDYGHKGRPESKPKDGKPNNKEISVKKSWESKVGEQIVTDADQNAVVVYTLYEKDGETLKEVDSVTKRYDKDNPQKSFNHTFTGLDDNKTYVVKERVSGYEPEYVSFENGVVTIKNEKDNDNPKPLNPSEPKVVTYGKRFVKVGMVDGEEKRLAGAEFLVKNANGEYLAYKADTEIAKDKAAVAAAKKTLDEKIAAYKALTAEEQKDQKGTDAIEAVRVAQEAYNKAFREAAGQYELVDKKDKDKANLVRLISDADGKFEITGLRAGEWYLEETKAPATFAKLEADVKFNVAEGSYNGTAQEYPYEKENTQHYGLKVENKKVTIPQTGGIGTAIFAVAGIALMAGAVIAMKKNRVEEN
uniref:pilin N-terminal domain-containing protein n=1 Tax=Peptoniphilus grossensis TaxID=1465756 RepID=UPI00288A34EB|nr:pilin N-terminal domain-containing protein [Peptoniphilus grossensis]